MNWYEIKNIEAFDTPALVLYRERITKNIASAVKLVEDPVRLRPHVKTNKISEVCTLMLDAGISKFKCATIAEAEMLAMINAKDVLLAYQPVGAKVERFIALVKNYPATTFGCLVDSKTHANLLSEKCGWAGISIGVFIDINVGMNRTGIHPSDVFDLHVHIQSLPNIYVRGLHGYDGHIRDSNVDSRKEHSDECYGSVAEIAQKIKDAFDQDLVIVSGGSPTFPVHAARQNIECSPGTFVFWDGGYKNRFPDEPFDFAALVITRVISVISKTSICVDLGHKSVAAEMPFPRVYFLNAQGATEASQSEEHLVLTVEDSSLFNLGDVLYGVPVHICPTVALHETALVVENNEIVDEWNVIARKRKINI
jgi:D-serine deaminase-like pyridoxal phosphate-dependent protein